MSDRQQSRTLRGRLRMKFYKLRWRYRLWKMIRKNMKEAP